MAVMSVLGSLGQASTLGLLGQGAAHRPARTVLRRLRAGLLVLNLLVAAILALLLWQFRAAELRDAEKHAVATASLLQQSASASFDKVAIAVNYAAAQTEAQLAPLASLAPPAASAQQGLASPVFWAAMNAATAKLPELQRMGLFDASGQRQCSPQDTQCQRYSIGDRDYFAALRQQPNAPPAVFGPIHTRPDNEPALLVARAFAAPGQPFAGIIVAVLPVKRLQPLVAAAKVGALGSARLRSSQLAYIARASDAPATDRPEPPSSDAVRQQVAVSPAAGVLRAMAAADQVDRVTAYQKLPGHPVYALVGLAMEDVMASWKLTVVWAVGFAGLFIIATLALERVAQNSLARQDQAQKLYDEAPCGYHTLDAQGRYLSINATELGWLGCTRQDVIGKLRPTDFFTDEGRAAFAANYPALQRNGSIDEQQYDLIGRQGQTRRVMVNARAVTDAYGQFVVGNAVMHDITALAAARTALLAHTAQQQAMLDSDLVGMLRVRGGTIVWANRGLGKITGYDSADWAAMPVARLHVDDTTYQQVAARIAALRTGAEAFRQDLPIRRKDGATVWVDASTLKLGPAGAESLTILKDISDRKKAEAERQHTLDLAVQNLALREAGRLKDEFLANLSHELRTPLNAIIGFSQLLQTDPALALAPKQAGYVRLVGDSGQHLLGLVQTMLDFAQTASQKLRFAPATVHVHGALTEVAQMLEPKRLAADVGLTVSVEPGLDTVIADPMRLRQMVLNLAANAVKFSRPGGVVALRAWPLSPSQWCVAVQDQGIGIAAEHLGRLFEPFVQLSAGSTKAYGGTGLGLALTRSIALAQGGDVQVRSALGQGSDFTLVLPRVLAAEDGLA